MSHTVKIQTQIRDIQAIQAACTRLKLPQPTQGEVRLFDRVASGIGVQLDGWRFPICVESDGNLLFDNFQGMWGAQEMLDQFQQAYAVRKPSWKRASRATSAANLLWLMAAFVSKFWWRPDR